MANASVWLQETQEQLQQHKAQWDQLVGRATDLESALEQWQAAYADMQQQLDASQVASCTCQQIIPQGPQVLGKGMACCSSSTHDAEQELQYRPCCLKP